MRRRKRKTNSRTDAPIKRLSCSHGLCRWVRSMAPTTSQSSRCINCWRRCSQAPRTARPQGAGGVKEGLGGVHPGTGWVNGLDLSCHYPPHA